MSYVYTLYDSCDMNLSYGVRGSVQCHAREQAHNLGLWFEALQWLQGFMTAVARIDKTDCTFA